MGNYINSGNVQFTKQMLRKLNKKVTNVSFVIHPTEYGDYDVIAIGDLSLLQKLKAEYNHFDLIEKSRFGGISILVIDICDTLQSANKVVKECKKL